MAILLDAIHLPPEMKVTKAWSPVAVSAFYAGDGTHVQQQQAKQGGRLITLAGERIGAGVTGIATYSLFQTLEALLTAGRTMTLALHGETFTITWDFSQTPLDYEPILFRRPPAATDPVLLTLRFLTLPT